MIPAQQMCLGCSCDLEPYDVGYAYEALTRATSRAGDPHNAAEYLSLAQTRTQPVKNAKHLALLQNGRGGLHAWRLARRCTRRALGAGFRLRANAIR